MSGGDNSGFDPAIPNVARVYDYMLGGKNNFAADRQLARQFLVNWPLTAWGCRQNRAFVGRAVRYCASHGISQFLDVGSGLPTMDNVHEVARRVNPHASVVYVDNDRVALTHAHALLATSCGVAAVWGDAREPGDILAQVETCGLLDMTRPLAVLMTGILHFIPDDDDPAGIVGTFKDAMPAGSYLVLSQGTQDANPAEGERAKNLWGSAATLANRSRGDIAAFFAGLELVEPGLVFTPQWRPEEPVQNAERASVYAGVGRKPGPQPADARS